MSGVFGITLDRSCWEKFKDGVPLLQHRGDEWGGFSVLRGNRIITENAPGKVTPLLEQKEGENPEIIEGESAIAHLSQRGSQPILIEDREGKILPLALAFDGKIINREELRRVSPYLTGTDAEILARLVASGKDPLDGIEKIYQYVKGPFSLVLLTLEGIFAARDVLGIRPLILARFFGDDIIGCAVASESIALEHIGMEIIRDVRPGEVVKIDSSGFKTLKQISGTCLIICGFEYGYWARPSAIIEGVAIGLSRYNAGIKLAPTCPEVDIVSSFPMSGNTVAEGLSFALKVPYCSIFDLNIEAGGRSFLPLSPKKRARRARNKLLIMWWSVNGLRVLVADDSIVEGNQTTARIFLIKESGAKEVHLRIETPTMRFRCPFDITPRGELMAATHTVEEMKKILGLKSLGFNTVEGFADAIISAQIGERKKKNPITVKNLCLGCFTGEFPQYK